MTEAIEQKKQLFKLKFKESDAFFSLTNIENIRDYGKKPVWFIHYRKEYASKRLYYKTDPVDRDTVIVTSFELEPIVFYWDNKYLRCAKTDKYVCCFCHKNECSGGSILFLSHNTDCAIEFTGYQDKGMLHYSKSPIYPGWSHNGGGFIIPAERQNKLEKNPVIAYHLIDSHHTLWMEQVNVESV